MPRFNFRLQQFLGIKEQIEDQKELEYAKAVRKYEEEKALLAQMNSQLAQQIEELRANSLNLIDPMEIKHLNYSVERLKIHILAQKERVAAAEAYAEKKRHELVEAMKERKALEIVRDKAQEAFNIEANLADQKQIDELVSFKQKIKITQTQRSG
jgi:flagellar FliJ protein